MPPTGEENVPKLNYHFRDISVRLRRLLIRKFEYAHIQIGVKTNI